MNLMTQEKHMTKTLFLALFMTVGVLGLSACGTVHGVGQDVESTGETIQDAAY
jgi:predicted small secreted protein